MKHLYNFPGFFQIRVVLLCYNEAYFGTGTRLVVMEHPVRVPKITILKPSPAELREKGKATVVCLVTDFYPDNIQIHWYVDGKKEENETKIQSDPESVAEEGGKSYSVSSRIRFVDEEWIKMKNVECRVHHYANGSDHTLYTSEFEVNAEICGMSKGEPQNYFYTFAIRDLKSFPCLYGFSDRSGKEKYQPFPLHSLHRSQSPEHGDSKIDIPYDVLQKHLVCTVRVNNCLEVQDSCWLLRHMLAIAMTIGEFEVKTLFICSREKYRHSAAVLSHLPAPEYYREIDKWVRDAI
ncbi:hypothetical protein chiPu_0017405 [Chiloscyllium punctatum]|uniref:Ig-like domain-containing protein n=1 Tax=Chiloscyllium punctatum TaxID=137246 RepID=A0A401RFR2_CHIPU|nr:hypothetical protein [Chiloscyllium punctatum]